MKLSCVSFLFIFLFYSSTVIAQSGSTPPSQAATNYGQWYGALGAAGLRSSLANNSDIGELANRSITYRLSKQQQRIHSAQQAGALTPIPFEFESSAEGIVLQTGIMKSLPELWGHHTALEGMMRIAERHDEPLDTRSEHIDFGIMWSANILSQGAGYLAVHGIYDRSDADVKFVSGQRKGDNLGLRFQAGEVLSSVWAYSLKTERVWWEGESDSLRPSILGPIFVNHDVEYTRDYFNLDVIARYRLTNFILPNTDIRWRSGIYYYKTEYEDQTNNLGQAVVEPFGAVERLGILRTGLQFAWRLGEQQQWSPFTEWMYDYEFQNNMDEVFSDPHTLTIKLGVAWLPARGKRYQFDMQRYQGLDNERVRTGATITILWDY